MLVHPRPNAARQKTLQPCPSPNLFQPALRFTVLTSGRAVSVMTCADKVSTSRASFKPVDLGHHALLNFDDLPGQTWQLRDISCLHEDVSSSGIPASTPHTGHCNPNTMHTSKFIVHIRNDKPVVLTSRLKVREQIW